MLFNVVRSPNYNPIEGVIAVCKIGIKKLRLRAVVLNKEVNLEAEIEKIFYEVEKKVYCNFI